MARNAVRAAGGGGVGVDPGRRDDTLGASPLARIEGASVVVSQHGSVSEASEDSDGLSWEAGRGGGHGVKRQVGADEEGFRGGSKATKVGGEGYQGGQDEDEADEDIHAR